MRLIDTLRVEIFAVRCKFRGSYFHASFKNKSNKNMAAHGCITIPKYIFFINFAKLISPIQKVFKFCGTNFCGKSQKKAKVAPKFLSLR